MTDKLEKLEELFGSQDVTPRKEAKAEAVSAAMQAFELEKSSEYFQGNDSGVRLNQQGGERKPLSKWRRMMNALNSRFTYGLMGSASVAVLALVVVGPNVTDLLRDDVTIQSEQRIDTAPIKKKEVAEETVRTEAQAVDDVSVVEQLAKPVAPTVTLNEMEAQSKPVPRQRSAKMKAPARMAYEQFSGGLAHDLSRPAPVDVLVPQYQVEVRDKFEKIKTNPLKVVRDNPVSTFSIDVDTASYAFIRSSINNGVLPPKNAIRVEELINYFDYDYATPKETSEPFKASVSVMPTPWNTGTKLMSIGIKGYELDRSEAPAANLVFLIDTSGSMNAPNKLPLLRNSFKLLLSTLKPDDTVSIVTYAGSAGTVLEPTRAENKNKILSALDSLAAGGSTAGAEGIRQAYALAEASFKKGGTNRVILATDGDFNVGISDPELLKGYIERKRDSGITLSILGFGRGNYNDQLMQTLAQNGNGNASYIDTLSEARKVLVEEAGSTLFTIAKDVKLQVEFNPTLVSEYRLIGYETRALKQEDFNNDKVDAGEIGAGHTVTALYEITPMGSRSQLVDDLRYSETTESQSSDRGDEYGFLKIRYKQPDGDNSTLITRPITSADEVGSLEDAGKDARFAASVAAFGQILRGGEYTGSYGLEDVVALAQSGKGSDPFGYRAEFINLVRLADTAEKLQPLRQ